MLVGVDFSDENPAPSGSEKAAVADGGMPAVSSDYGPLPLGL
jgi:hypothetical protein